MKKRSETKGLPETKKGIKTFLLNEDGKVTKKALVTGAILMTIVGIATEAYGHGSHANNAFRNPPGDNRGQHNSHTSHGSHASHGSHDSHGSHGSHGSHASHGSHGSW